jgi:HlyD family secretion protein
LFWGVASTLLAAFLAWSFVPAAVPVDVAEVTQGPMSVRVTTEGSTRVKDIYALSAPVAGRLLRIAAKAGDAVIAGQTELAVIEPADPSILDKRSRAEAEAQVQAAVDALALAAAEVERAQAQLTFAKTELDRAVLLRKNETIAQRALDVATLEVATREAALKSSEATARVRSHELETARARLITPTTEGGGEACCVSLSAPVDGQVLRVLTQSEGVVQVGTPLLEVGDPRRLEVVADVLTSDAARLREGAEVVISKWGGADLQGQVRRIEPFGYTKVSVLGIEEQRVDVIVDFVDLGTVPAMLGHGFRVEVGVLEWQADAVVKAPLSALFRIQGGWAVFLYDDGHARLAPVEVGHMNGNEAEIEAGLSVGDRVIIHPGDRVTDGVSVTLRQG